MDETIRKKLDKILDEVARDRKETQESSERLTAVEIRLESLDKIIEQIVTIIRGDGNGNHGVLSRLQSGGHQMERLVEEQFETRKEVQDLAKRITAGTMSTKDRIKAFLQFVGPIIVAIITAIAAAKSVHKP